MFNKIIIGTANFTRSYGILSSGEPLPKDQIDSILTSAFEKGITTLDTAVGYGDIISILPTHLLSSFHIITKFSVLEEKKDILKNFSDQKKNTNFNGFYGVLIHDPQNIPLVGKSKLKDLLDCLRNDCSIQKIGVSVYDMIDVERFNSICMPDIIQIPLNPFNQSFNNDHFKSMVREKKIEVHARSLFLQGILLSDTLPDILTPLKPFWLEFQRLLAVYPLRLHALLQWAFDFEWIKSWVLGVSCIGDLEGIIRGILYSPKYTNVEFQPVDHPLVDPRNWR